MSAAHSISTAPARGRWLVPSLVFLFLLALLPWASSPFILHLAILTTLNITIVNGLALVSRSGQLSLGHAAFMAIGSYVAFLIGKQAGLPFLLSCAAGNGVHLLVALDFGWMLLPLRGVSFVLVDFSFGRVDR